MTPEEKEAKRKKESLQRQYEERLKIADKTIVNSFGEEFKDAHLSKVELPEDVVAKVVEFANKNANMLVFCGNPGLGKTYLCAAFARHFSENFRNWRAFKAIDFLAQLRRQINDGSDYSSEIKYLSDQYFFILDDLGVPSSDWQKEVMFDFIDKRWASNLPTIITSNLLMADIEKHYGERFTSRLKDKKNTIIQLNWKDKRIEN